MFRRVRWFIKYYCNRFVQAPYVYNWSNGSSTQNISNLSAGTYTVTVTDANGCSQNQTETISQPNAALNANASITANLHASVETTDQLISRFQVEQYRIHLIGITVLLLKMLPD